MNTLNLGNLRIITFLLLLVTPLARAQEIELADGEITAPRGGPKQLEETRTPLDGEVVFINGRDTSSAKAIEQTKATGDKLGLGVRLIYNDLTLPVIDDIAIAWDKLFNAGVSLNAATDTLIKRIKSNVEAGKSTHIIGFSAGSIIANNAVRAVAEDYEDRSDDERATLLGSIHVLTVGSAVFADDHCLADGWPKGLGSVYHLHDRKDGVAQFAGPGEWGGDNDAAHAYLSNYLRIVEPSMLRENGSKVVDNSRPASK